MQFWQRNIILAFIVRVTFIDLMKKIIYSFLAAVVLLASCEGTKEDTSTERVAKGAVVYGGTFTMSEAEKFQSLFPHTIIDLGSANIAKQIFEGLVKFSPKDMSVIPALAENWEIDASGTVYTFKLRKGAKFHDDPCFDGGEGREMNANDVKYSFEMLCTASPDNAMFTSTFKDRVKGATAYYNGEAESLEGVKVIDDYTVEITLEQPSSSFLYILANPATSVVAKEAVDKYGIQCTIGTGPFKYTEGGEVDKELFLVYNEDYYKLDSAGNQLPYLDTVHYRFINSQNTQLDEFRNGGLDVIFGLPSEKINEVVQEQIADFANVPPKFILGRSPEMVTQFYEFNLTREVFQDVRVRQAFSYAIDKDKIVNDILNREAFGPGINGLCPPSFPGYDVSKVSGYSYDPDKARALLADAGYPNGSNFPSIKVELNSGGTRNTRVAFEIQKQLSDVLNINVDIEVVPFAQKLEDAKYAKADIFRSAWVADYPSPESFLWTCYGRDVPASLDEPSHPNTMRYQSAAFDSLFEKGIAARDKEESYGYFTQAEQILMQDAPLIPLWYSENYRLLQSYVRNFYSNPMNLIDLTDVYIKEREGKVQSQGHQ